MAEIQATGGAPNFHAVTPKQTQSSEKSQQQKADYTQAPGLSSGAGDQMDIQSNSDTVAPQQPSAVLEGMADANKSQKKPSRSLENVLKTLNMAVVAINGNNVSAALAGAVAEQSASTQNPFGNGKNGDVKGQAYQRAYGKGRVSGQSTSYAANNLRKVFAEAYATSNPFVAPGELDESMRFQFFFNRQMAERTT